MFSSGIASLKLVLPGLFVKIWWIYSSILFILLPGRDTACSFRRPTLYFQNARKPGQFLCLTNIWMIWTIWFTLICSPKIISGRTKWNGNTVQSCKFEMEVGLYQLTTACHKILAVSDFAVVIELNYAVIIQVKNGHWHPTHPLVLQREGGEGVCLSW